MQVDPRLTPGWSHADPACFQCLKIKHDKLPLNAAFICNMRHYNVVRFLHSRGANMNAQDMWNYATPLILAAEGGHPEAGPSKLFDPTTLSAALCILDSSSFSSSSSSSNTTSTSSSSSSKCLILELDGIS